MLGAAVRGLSRAGKAAQASFQLAAAFQGAPGSQLGLQTGAAGFGGAATWRSVFRGCPELVGSRALLGGPWMDGEERDSAPGLRGLHTAAAVLRADTSNVPPGQGGSTFNDPDRTAREAGAPTATAGGESGTSYMILAAAHAGLAATAFFAPNALVNAFFPGAALPQGMQLQVLSKVLGCGLGAGAASCLALKESADSGELASPTAQRLQLGLMGFSTGAIALHLLYSPSITLTSLGMGAVTMGATFGIPYGHYVKTNGGLKPGEALGSYIGAVPDHLNITGLQSGLYALLTPTLALAGASYLFMPSYTLGNVFGYARGIESLFFWQCVGGALMTVVPAITYSLKKAADEGALGQKVYKTLNAGLAATAAGHLAVLAPMYMANQGGPMLPWVLGAWSTALLAGGLGMMKGGAGAAATV